MARRPFIAGNWKMNLNRAGAIALAKAIAERAQGLQRVELAVCPPSAYLDVVGKVPNADEAAFQKAAETAKAGCPVSKVLKADITMNAKLG